MSRVQAKFLALFVLVLWLAGCARGQRMIEPPAIHYGEDRCAECGMIISDARFASGLLYEIGEGRYESLIFDDIGDMMAYVEKHPEQHIVAWYVHDYASEAWLDATQAYFVSSPELHTPMAHGIAAHTSQAAAQAMADELQGKVFDWPALQALHDHTSHAHAQ
jgi:copper chaperone NosL